MAEVINVREVAAQVLLLDERGEQKGKEALQAALLKYQYISKKDRAFLSRMVNGVIEYKLRLDYVLNQFSNTPMNKCKPYIRCILRLGAYQILFLNSVPASAACNESVKLTKKHGFQRLSGYVNGVLRSLVRGQDSIIYPNRDKEPMKYLSVTYSLPLWLVELFIDQYGYETANIMARASVKPSSLTVRFQQNHSSIEAIKQRMEREGLVLSPIEVNPAMEELLGQELIEQLLNIAVRIEQVDYLTRYESFLDGCYTVQDVSSMLPGLLLQQIRKESLEYGDMNKAGQNKGDDCSRKEVQILDMCASPGGKSCHIASLSPDYLVRSRDISEKKTQRIRENVERLGLTNVMIEEQDALEFTEELCGAMDAVLLDAPCSGLGVLGRKKEIAYSITPEGIKDLIRLQRDMLENACRYVKENGILLYSTCTVNQGENRDNASWFLNRHKEFVLVRQYQLLPGVMPLDGFFVAVFRKKE